ncbi:MAG: hypothetical protein FWF02_00110 [Micrococcales bacterium]|nr:hypothetical protein [Micrococcales bacterium]MCL2666102.1 hypothetical protein [Micrococcales bacterium]
MVTDTQTPTEQAVRRAWVRGRPWDPLCWPWWVQTLAVYAASRLWLFVVFSHSAAHQPAGVWAPAAPTYFDFVSVQFDGDWYRKIAECDPQCGFAGLGYPDDLPVDAKGDVRQNAWAFFPAFPALVRQVMNLTGGSWEVTAPLVATVLGALAMLVIHRLVVDGAPKAVAAWPGLPLATVAVVCAFPTAGVLQTAYTESLALLLIAVSLWAVVRRWYPLAAVAVVVLGFTRAVALPMAVVVLAHGAARWWAVRRARLEPEPDGTAPDEGPPDSDGASPDGGGTDASGAPGDEVPLRDRIQIAGLFVVAVASGFCWPWLTGWHTGTPDAYLRTQQAWRVTATDPFSGWQVSQFWVGRMLTGLGIDHTSWDPVAQSHMLEVATVLVVFAAIVLIVALLVLPAGRRVGPELVAWSTGYLAYIAAVIEPGSSLARFLLLAFPMATISIGLVSRSPWARRTWLAVLLVVMLWLQTVWVDAIWTYSTDISWPP